MKMLSQPYQDEMEMFEEEGSGRVAITIPGPLLEQQMANGMFNNSYHLECMESLYITMQK